MTTGGLSEPFKLPDLDWGRLAELLRAADYQTERIGALAGITESVTEILSDTARMSLVYADDLAETVHPAAALAELFLLGCFAPAARLDLLDSALVSLLTDFGLIVADENRYTATVAITEFRGRYLLSDPLFTNTGTDVVMRVDPDRCMPLHASSLELMAGLRAPLGATSFLDVGCGSGCQSIIVAGGYSRIAGMDLSPRSVAYARANAALNGVDVDYYIGDCTAIPDERRYDHVAFNSPSAATAYAFISNSLQAILEPGGVAQVWACCELTYDDVDPAAVLDRNIRDSGRFNFTVHRNLGSRFALGEADLCAGRLPKGSLLINRPREREEFFAGLAARHVREIVSLIADVTVA